MECNNIDVHAISWAAQGDIQIKCTKEWNYLYAAQVYKKIITLKQESGDNLRVSFYHEEVTCNICKNGAENGD